MQIPRVVARFNKLVNNRIQSRWAHRMPGYGLLEHTGRKSGKVYRVPLNVFSAPGGFVVVIMYGTESDWLRNVRAAGGGHLTHRGKRYVITNPQLLTDGSGRRLLPRPLRFITRVAHIDNVLRVEAAPV